ncbi:hypothetical protein PS1_007469 [Malus domestica]
MHQNLFFCYRYGTIHVMKIQLKWRRIAQWLPKVQFYFRML